MLRIVGNELGLFMIGYGLFHKLYVFQQYIAKMHENLANLLLSISYPNQIIKIPFHVNYEHCTASYYAVFVK